MRPIEIKKKGNVLNKSDVTTTTFIVAEVTNGSDTQRSSELGLLYLGGSGFDAPSWGSFSPEVSGVGAYGC